MTFISALKLQAIVDIFHKLNIKNSYKIINLYPLFMTKLILLDTATWLKFFTSDALHQICLPQVRSRLQWPFLDCIVLL